MFFRKKDSVPPIDSKIIIHILVAVIIVLSLIAGYYYTKYGELLKSYHRLQIKYERLVEKKIMQSIYT